MKKVKILFVITNIICAFGWLNRYITSLILAKHMLDKNCPMPTNEELQELRNYVAQHLMPFK